jgi:hypothetical protein
VHQQWHFYCYQNLKSHYPLEKNTKPFDQGSRTPGRGLNRGPSRQKAQLLITRPRHSAVLFRKCQWDVFHIFLFVKDVHLMPGEEWLGCSSEKIKVNRICTTVHSTELSRVCMCCFYKQVHSVSATFRVFLKKQIICAAGQELPYL